jgi:hypothetical protein
MVALQYMSRASSDMAGRAVDYHTSRNFML